MKAAMIGYGQMGQMIKTMSKNTAVEIVATIDPYSPDADFKQIDAASLAGVDVAICFTSPDAALENIQKVLELKVPLVMGTTGWLDHKEQVEQWVAQAGVGMVYSSNFSIGVNLFFSIVAEAARMVNQFDMYDVMAVETHHKLKRDSPSGTALTLGELLLENLSKKDTLVTERLDRRPEPNELHFASIRGGHVPGTHQIEIDSEFDTIELTHRARNRGGFASGALVAAQWITKQTGFFTEREMMAHLLSQK